jgi:hypothetical protein
MTMKTHRIVLLLCALALPACGDDAVQEDEITAPVTGLALVKFFHFGVGGPGVNFYANEQKMTAISSATGAESTTGTVYGGVGAGGLYTAIEPGQYTFKAAIAAAVDKGLAIASLPATLAQDKAYSFYLSGVYNTATKSQEAFVVEDDVPAQDYATACVRFVNAIFNSNPMTLYATSTTASGETKIGDAVAYKGGSTFTCLAPGSYNLATRLTGSTTNAITRTGVSFVNGRAYTIAARGNMTVTTGATSPFLDNTANR